MRIIIVLIVAIALISCKDETVVSEISGVVYQNCEKVPFAFAEVALVVNKGQSFSEPIIIGGDVSDANGLFKFNYELEENEKGTANLILVNPQGYENLASNLELSKDYNLSLVEENIASLIVNLSGNRNFGANDTLYMALSTGLAETYIINPNNGYIDTIKAFAENTVNTQSTVKFMFGYGLKDFERSKAAFAADTFWRHRNVNLTGCNQFDILDLVLN